MSSKSQEFNALKTITSLFFESNSNSIYSDNNTQARGFFLRPSPDVPGRPADITGYILRASNEEGKLEWSEEQGNVVSGSGSIWFSNSDGSAGGDQLNLYWNNITKKLGIALNGLEPDYSIDVLGGIQTDTLYLNSGNANIAISPPPTLSSSFILTLPDGTGNPNQVLSTDGTGNLFWKTNSVNLVPGAGTVWFSNSLGEPTGDTAKFNWDNTALNIDGDINVTSIVTALNFKAFSDENLKTNIKPIENGLEIIGRIDPVSYNWKNKESKPQMGVIAQQLENIGLDSIVEEVGKYKSVDYNQLIPIIIAAIKELKEKI